jgi:hypothetical protein
MSNELLQLKGIGTVTAEKLTENGFDTIKKLATTTTERLSQVEGFSINRASLVIEQARIIMAQTIINKPAPAAKATGEKKPEKPKDKKEKKEKKAKKDKDKEKDKEKDKKKKDKKKKGKGKKNK